MVFSYQYEDGLVSERLVTRFLTPADVDTWTTFFYDEEAIALFPTWGLNTAEEKAQQWIDRQLNRYKENRFGMQALIDRSSGAFIGQSGLTLQEVDGILELEVGYHIFQKYWGQGLATEAARLFMQYAKAQQLSDSLISIIDIRNVRSMRVADKNGLYREKRSQWNGLDVYVYRWKY